MMMARRTIVDNELSRLAPLLLAACTTTASETGAPTNDEAPVWSDAPTDTTTIGEGRTIAMPFTVSDPDGGEVTSTFVTGDGFDAEVVDDELRVHADYGTTTAQISVTLTDDEGTSSEVAFSVTVLPLGWVDYQSWTTMEGPEEREHAQAFFHRESNSAFVFGGSGYHPQFTQRLEDYWRYDVATGAWTAITPTGDVPDGAGSRRVAGAWGSGERVMFGGYLGMFNANDLYRVSVEGGNLAFEALEATGTIPSGRALHAFVQDPSSGRYFMFGGINSAPLNDTWMLEVDGSTATWTQLELANPPSPRYGFFYGFDEDAGRLIVYSGAQGTAMLNPATDTWALDVRTDPPSWALIVPEASSPPGRRNGCGVWDPSGPRLVVFGGTPDAMNTAPGLFVLDARPGHERWTTLALADEPDARSSGFGFASEERVFMGFGNNNGGYRDWGVLGY